MEYYYRTVKCPRCGKVIEKTRTTNTQVLHGSPFRTCPNCGSSYFDPMYKELAILHFESKGGNISPFSVIVSIVLTFAAGLLIYFTITNTNSGNLFAAVFMSILALLFDIGMVIAVYSRIHSDE